MASPTAKSLALLLELRDRLARRTTLAMGDVAFDTDECPYFLVGTGVAASQSMLVKASGIQPVGKDGIGLDARAFTPSVLQVVLEASGTDTGSPLMTGANLIPLLGEVFRQGTRVELYLSANGSTTVVGDITGTPVAVWEADLQYRLMDAQ